jgi:hypothetical protein
VIEEVLDPEVVKAQCREGNGGGVRSKSLQKVGPEAGYGMQTRLWRISSDY